MDNANAGLILGVAYTQTNQNFTKFRKELCQTLQNISQKNQDVIIL